MERKPFRPDPFAEFGFSGKIDDIDRFGERADQLSVKGEKILVGDTLDGEVDIVALPRVRQG